MSRRMSCSMTIDAVKDRTKTVTRRHVDTWQTLKAGDRLTLIEKGMGLAKGEKQIVLAEVEVTAVWVEPLATILLEPFAVKREGMDRFGYTHRDFIRFWLGSHGYNADVDSADDVLVRRIEWSYP